jgi:hypothetical protein
MAVSSSPIFSKKFTLEKVLLNHLQHINIPNDNTAHPFDPYPSPQGKFNVAVEKLG